LRRQATKADTEILGHWSALVARLLHTKVMDISSLKDRTLQRKIVDRDRFMTSNTSRMVGRLRHRASQVVMAAKQIAKKVCSRKKDIFDSEWKDSSLMTRLFGTEYIDTLILLANTAAKVISSQPALLSVDPPCKIFGDLHGQLRDMLALFGAFGAPGDDLSMSFVFNGDFIDRGCHQVEVMGVLLSLKVLYPENVWLVRGNHEDRSMNEKYGFEEACYESLGHEFGPKVCQLCQNLFDRLPIACLIAGKILCVHGGLGDGTFKLDDLRTVPRPLKTEDIFDPANSWIFNILWSDPIEDGRDADPSVFGVHESPRGGVAARFAWNVTKTFCARNGLSLIVRSHQSKRESRGFDVMHENLLVRVFSARDYEGHGNDGAILQVTEEITREGEPILIVRPQVARSVTKLRNEARKHT